MRQITRKWNPLLLPFLMSLALSLMFCEPGKSLDPELPDPNNTPGDTGKIAIFQVTAPGQILPTDTALIKVSVRDTTDSLPLGRARVFITSSQFTLLSSSSNAPLAIDSLPLDGEVSFRVFSATPGTGTVTVRVVSGPKQRSTAIRVIVTEKPVAPKVMETFPLALSPGDTTLLTLTVVDSAQEKPLANAVVTLSSGFFSIHSPTRKDTISMDTTGSDGRIAFRVFSADPGTGTLQVRVRTAAGLLRTSTYTLSVDAVKGDDRNRKMIFTAVRSTLRADGGDSTELKVLVKDDNNNPLSGEKIRFTATGGVVRGSAVTDEWGRASTFLVSERANKTVVVTATLEKTGATAQQTVAFDGVVITISPEKSVLRQDLIDNVVFEVRDGGGVPMSGDSLEITVADAYKGFGQASSVNPETLIVITDTKGQYRTSITSHDARNIVMTARALGATASETVTFTNNSLTLVTTQSSLKGDGTDQLTITARLRDGSNAAMVDRELRWTTTFGSFTTTPFTSTNSSGDASIVLRSSKGSGLAVVNVEAYSKPGGDARNLVASGTVEIPIKALKVNRIELKVTPDNIPVKVGEARLVAQAYDSANNVMTGVLVAFKLVKGAGGGDEIITPPIDYTKSGQAEALIKAGGVISLYRGVQLSAVALDISGTDTLVIAASDTVGLTISGPPHRVSVGVNIEKGHNPNDGTFGLPTAAVVTDVNGNLVADGTPVNFSTTPVGAFFTSISWHYTDFWPYYYLGDTVYNELPWTDYNNNRKLDPDETASRLDLAYTHPYRGEDRDGNGYINFPPESFDDLNQNGVWDSVYAEPTVYRPYSDTVNPNSFVDFNKNGVQDTREPFTDKNNDGKCQCAGTYDANGNLYEMTHFGSTSNHPFPGEVSVGLTKQISTLGGKAINEIWYVQSLALYVKVRITAESNGIRSSMEVVLPRVKSD